MEERVVKIIIFCDVLSLDDQEITANGVENRKETSEENRSLEVRSKERVNFK